MNSHVFINLKTINDPDENWLKPGHWTNPDVLFVMYTLFEFSKTFKCFSSQQQTWVYNKCWNARGSAFGSNNKRLSVSFLTTWTVQALTAVNQGCVFKPVRWQDPMNNTLRLKNYHLNPTFHLAVPLFGECGWKCSKIGSRIHHF